MTVLIIGSFTKNSSFRTGKSLGSQSQRRQNWENQAGSRVHPPCLAGSYNHGASEANGVTLLNSVVDEHSSVREDTRAYERLKIRRMSERDRGGKLLKATNFDEVR